jgi:hypothetical protein
MPRFKPAVPLTGILALSLAAGIAKAQTVQLIPVTDAPPFSDDGTQWAKGVNLRSAGNQLGNTIRTAVGSGGLVTLPGTAPTVSTGAKPHAPDLSDIQINDPNLDNIQTFPGTRPFEASTQSETSVTQSGQNILVGYNSSANAPIVKIGSNLFYTHIFFSAYSVSHDGGTTWTSGFLPPPSGSIVTLGDPAVAVDRAGNFYYSNLALDASFTGVIAVNKSTDHGTTFSAGTIVATDDGSDKDWIAVGPDPQVPSRDNVYVTWTSFQNNGSTQLWFAKSTDGGATWTSRAIFAPSNSGVMSNQLSLTTPVVDASSGRLYIPFLHFSFIDADMIRVLVSDDAGATFHFLAFNVPGAPDAFAYPNVTPGVFADCGNGGFRNVLFQGSDVGGGRFGLPRYIHSTRVVTQPAAAAARGRFVLGFQTSTSPFFGDPTAGSMINLLYSQDGGASFFGPTIVSASTPNDPQHVHPTLSLGQNGNTIYVAYYVQQSDTKLRTDVATLHIDGNHVGQLSTQPLSTTSFDLTPSNIPFPKATSITTTHYDRTIVPCYDIGEYMSILSTDLGPLAAWGDNRRSWTSPATSPAAGTHAQSDVFFRNISK